MQDKKLAFMIMSDFIAACQSQGPGDLFKKYLMMENKSAFNDIE